ncbi:hypothetical protein [Persephonella sp. KM09-Lau-8]|uniref:hypothetical protein n=1 Tax=Persephonella sp. KM09-Lau-8 TaxID=1158345 RepID=UPI000496AA04|nr:hypothetical protein [Persephonella sp. KM09-Lau-8]
MKHLFKIAKLSNSKNAIDVYAQILNKYLESRKIQQLEQTKRLKIEKEIQTIKLLAEVQKNIIEQVGKNRRIEKNKKLDHLLEKIDKYIDDPGLLPIFLKIFETVMKQSTITQKDIELLAKAPFR